MHITLTDIKELLQSEPATFPLLEQNVIIRTVTYHYTGYASHVIGGYLVLTNAAWIADSGRWSDALSSGTLIEVEPYPDSAYISLQSVVDASPWDHDLPRAAL